MSKITTIDVIRHKNRMYVDMSHYIEQENLIKSLEAENVRLHKEVIKPVNTPITPMGHSYE